MNLQLKLEKVPQEDLEMFKNAINHYSETLQVLLDTIDDRKYAKDLSIAVELWYDIHKKTVQQHPAERSTVKLSLHKAYVLLEVLKNYNGKGISDYERSRCNRYYMEIDQQTPTITQLLINRS